MKIYLVGNKCDLENDRRVSKEEVDDVINQYNIVNYIETSSKTGYNSKQLFVNVANTLYKDFVSHVNDTSRSIYSKNSSSIHVIGTSEKFNIERNNISTIEVSDKKKGCCC